MRGGRYPCSAGARRRPDGRGGGRLRGVRGRSAHAAGTARVATAVPGGGGGGKRREDCRRRCLRRRRRPASSGAGGPGAGRSPGGAASGWIGVPRHGDRRPHETPRRKIAAALARRLGSPALPAGNQRAPHHSTTRGKGDRDRPGDPRQARRMPLRRGSLDRTRAMPVSADFRGGSIRLALARSRPAAGSRRAALGNRHVPPLAACAAGAHRPSYRGRRRRRPRQLGLRLAPRRRRRCDRSRLRRLPTRGAARGSVPT